MYYDDVEYAAKRLNETLLRTLDGKPIYIYHTRKIGGDIFCQGDDLVTGESVDVNLKDIDLTPVPLGFYNISGKMAFACRKPMRKDWKQGLSTNSLVLYGADKRDFSFKHLTQTIMSVYPSYTECLHYLKKTRNRSMAFSRDFGLSNKLDKLQIVYRKYPVGQVENDVVVLNRDKFFLEQHLTSAMGN